MDYFINPMAFSAVFTVPSEIVDCHLKLAKAEHIKVILYVLKNMAQPIDASIIAESLNMSEYEVEEALLYWADAGIVMSDNSKPLKDTIDVKIVKQDIKPSRADVSKRGAEDPKIRFLLREAQIKMGRNLKSNEASTLVWLYDDQGLDISLILLIIQYAVQHKKCNIRFIESVAVDWINKGINDITSADEQLQKMALGEQAWGIVTSAFGLERRKPSTKETEHSIKWICEWKISKELLSLAYEECVNQKSKFSFAYTAKIIESWHEKGIKDGSQLQQMQDQNKKNDIAAYDLDLFEKMLRSKD